MKALSFVSTLRPTLLGCLGLAVSLPPLAVSGQELSGGNNSTLRHSLASQAATPGRLNERIAGREISAAHPALDDPKTRTVGAAEHVRPDDVVAGLVVSGVARAYPWWILKNHHVVNDRIEGVDVLIAFCEQCSAATAFRRRLDDRVLSLETEGVYGGTIILRDRETDTLWAPFDGLGLDGPLAGRQLERLQVFLTTWSDWSARHPETRVIYEPTAHRHGHGSREHPGKWGIVGVMGETLSNWDTRLAENDFVYGLRAVGGPRAYPLHSIRERGGIVSDVVDGVPVVIMARGAFEMAAYDRRLKEFLLTFEPVEGTQAQMRDLETGSLWTIEGVAIEGRHRGQRLQPLEGYPVEWHVWSEYYPETKIYAEEAYQPPTGFQLPIRSLPRLVGERVITESPRLDAETNLVMLWARWCPPCRDKLPLMRRLATGQAEGGYRFISIVIQLPEEAEMGALKGLIYEHDIDWPIYLLDDERYVEMDERVRAQGGRGLMIPMLFVTDRSGKVLHLLEGQDVESVETLISTPAAPP